MISSPAKIPCVTQEVNQFMHKPEIKNPKLDLLDLALYSVNVLHKGVPFKAKKLTIIDCHTYFLKNKLRDFQAAADHYRYFTKWCNAYAKEHNDLVVIAPDFDWLPERYHAQLCTRWFRYCGDVPQLIVPNTPLHKYEDQMDVRGYAVRESQDIVHPKWTHSLGITRKQDLNTECWTCDSTSFSI